MWGYKMIDRIKQFFSKSFNIGGLACIIGLLGSLGGQGIKGLRRFGIPCLVTIYAYFLLQNWWVLSILSMIGVFSIGYGIPELNGIITINNPKTFSDEGSALGRMYYNLFKGNTILANIFTRGTIGKLMCLSLLSIPFIKGTWVGYSLGSIGIIISWALISWQGFGVVKFNWFGKNMEVCKVDIIFYSILGCLFYLIINY